MTGQRTFRGLGRRFNRILSGVIATIRNVKVGRARVILLSASKRRVRLVGLCVKASHDAKLSPVRLYFDDCLVSEAPVRELPGGLGRFEFRIKRASFAGLTAQSVSMEVAGVRRVLTRKDFGSHWPEEFKDNPATNPRVLARLKRGYKLDRMGVLAQPKNTNDAWLRSVFRLYDRARAWFKTNYGYDLYPVGGTLLGYARSGEVISFDNDFDTAYLSSHTNPDDIRREYKEIILRLLADGVDVRILTGSNPPKVRRDYFWYGNGKTHIDVFVGAFIDSKYRRPTFVDTQLTREDFFPFETKKLNGRDILVPKNVEKKVAAVYGPGWRSPDPLWKKVRTPEILAYREQIRLTEADLLDVAAASRVEGPTLRQLVESGTLETS